MACDAKARAQFKHGGSTATLAFVSGWELLVANCGDSCAYLDTGTETLLVRGSGAGVLGVLGRVQVWVSGGALRESPRVLMPLTCGCEHSACATAHAAQPLLWVPTFLKAKSLCHRRRR